MTHRSPPLISHLRRRLTAVTWVFAVLVLVKVGLATPCFADGLTSLPNGVVSATEITPLTMTVSVPSDDESGSCWHAGPNGCHCACAHSTVLAPTAWTLVTIPFVALRVTLATPTPLAAFCDDPLRPPIA